MKRFTSIALLLLLALASPAQAKRLATIPITAPVTASVSTPLQIQRLPITGGVSIQIKLIYGSGGTTIAAWVQTSLDGGATWVDVASQAFTTASLAAVFNVSALTPKIAALTPQDGALATATAVDGVVGPIWRVKWTTTGTYVGTTLSVDLNGAMFTTSP
jgi:hypothetical protein